MSVFSDSRALVEARNTAMSRPCLRCADSMARSMSLDRAEAV